MNQYENIKKYAKNCISGEIISCKKHKWACERFLKDAEQFENNPDYPFTGAKNPPRILLIGLLFYDIPKVYLLGSQLF